MKNIFILLFSFLTLSSCVSDDFYNDSPYLPYAPVDISIRLTDWEFRDLMHQDGAVFIDDGYSGLQGIIIFNTGRNGFRAYDAACPNHPIRNCSTLQFDGTLLYCTCENDEFSMRTGRPLQSFGYPLREYPVTTFGSLLEVHN